MLKNLECIQDQVSANGVVQCPCPDQREVRDESAKLGFVLDATDEIHIGRIVLVDNRSPLQFAAIDQHVDLIAAK